MPTACARKVRFEQYIEVTGFRNLIPSILLKALAWRHSSEQFIKSTGSRNSILCSLSKVFARKFHFEQFMKGTSLRNSGEENFQTVCIYRNERESKYIDSDGSETGLIRTGFESSSSRGGGGSIVCWFSGEPFVGETSKSQRSISPESKLLTLIGLLRRG